MEIEPLLSKLEQLAPQFGRAREDIAAMAVRGRARDFKGVMQNARLVLETLLRAMVATELKQTPGKAMLDELITKFRQQANQGVVPTNVLAHMGTVQAWGNLSSHDHAAGLDAEAVKVGEDEVVASLNSMVAILGWYAGRYGSTATPAAPLLATPAPGTALVARTEAPKSKSGMMIGVGVGAVALIGGLIFFGFGHRQPAAAVSPPSFAMLDPIYAKRGEPPPPASCRNPTEAEALAPVAEDWQALSLLALSSAEADYLLARAIFERQAADKASGAFTIPRDIDPRPTNAHATRCAGFAAAQSLAGKIAVSDGKLDEAEKRFQLALAAAPDFQNARFNLGAVYLKQGKKEQGVLELEHVLKAEPNRADAHLLLGIALEALGKPDEAKPHFCAADKLGETAAHERCVR